MVEVAENLEVDLRDSEVAAGADVTDVDRVSRALRADKVMADVLFSEGHSKATVQRKMLDERDEARGMFDGCASQTDLEARIARSFSEACSDGTKILPQIALSTLYGFVREAPFDFDVRSWINAILRHPLDMNALGMLLRFFEFWQHNFSDAEIAGILDDAESACKVDVEPMRLYAQHLEKLIDRFGLDAPFSKHILQMVMKGGRHYKLLSLFPVGKFDEEIGRWGHFDQPVVQSDAIRDLPYARCSHVGVCSEMLGGHRATLLGDARKPYLLGQTVLIYVSGLLVGSMKQDGERSILGLRTIQNSAGSYSMIAGCCYDCAPDLMAQATAVFHGNKPCQPWARLDLDELEVAPRRYVWGKRGWSYEGASKLVRSIVRAREKLESPRDV